MSRLITGGESPVCEGREIRGEEIIHLDNWTQHLKDLKEKPFVVPTTSVQ